MFDADAAEVFDPDMLALLKADASKLDGEVGVIDGDWLCDCQDFASIRANIKVTWATPTRATATAAIVDTGVPDKAARLNLFTLDKVGGAWRIHDIQETGQPSLRQMLSDEVKNGPA